MCWAQKQAAIAACLSALRPILPDSSDEAANCCIQVRNHMTPLDADTNRSATLQIPPLVAETRAVNWLLCSYAGRARSLVRSASTRTGENRCYSRDGVAVNLSRPLVRLGQVGLDDAVVSVLAPVEHIEHAAVGIEEDIKVVTE